MLQTQSKQIPSKKISESNNRIIYDETKMTCEEHHEKKRDSRGDMPRNFSLSNQ